MSRSLVISNLVVTHSVFEIKVKYMNKLIVTLQPEMVEAPEAVCKSVIFRINKHLPP